MKGAHLVCYPGIYEWLREDGSNSEITEGRVCKKQLDKKICVSEESGYQRREEWTT